MTALHNKLRNALSRPAGAVAAAVGLSALLHLPAFRYELISDDEAIYDAMAQVVARGGVMYRDTVDHKPPGLVYTYAAIRWVVDHLGGTFPQVLAGVHLVGLLVAAGTSAALYGIASYVLEKRLAWIPAVLFALVFDVESAPRQPRGQRRDAHEPADRARRPVRAGGVAYRGGARALLNVVAGAMCGVAALYKYQAALVGLSFLFLIPLDVARNPKRLALELFTRGTALAVGLALPFAAAAAYFYEHGALRDAIAWGIEFNRHYLAEGPDLWTAIKRFSLQFFGMVVPNFVVYGAGLFSLWRILRGFASKPASPEAETVTGVTSGHAMLVVWTLESLFCVTLGRRFFGHYFLQPELPIALLAAGPIAALWDRRPRLVAYGIGLPAGVFFLVAAVPEVTHKWVYIIDPDYDTVGRAAAAETGPRESIWVWGNVPQIYYAAERMPGVRFTFCNYLTGLSPGTRSEYDPSVDPRKNAVTSAWDA